MGGMTWKRVCKNQDVEPNSIKQFEVDGVSIAIANYGSGFRAIPPMCPHMEEPLKDSGVIVRCVLTCTKHLWAWNLETLEMRGETEKSLKCYELKEEDGEILVFIENELIYDFDEGEGEEDDFFK